ncbi:MAG TPA: GFA family protein [Xanthobacteraceae bacterium]|nr:GFA family protein [Xanthobacteraceae bacterium]
MKIDGACHCGGIQYEGEADPEKAAICHCTDCQTLSGSAFRTVVPVHSDHFRIVAGEPTIYVKTGESGNKREQAFCPRCGSPIYATAPGDGPKVYNIRAGTIRQRDQFVPKVQWWSRSKQRWINDIASMREVAKQ